MSDSLIQFPAIASGASFAGTCLIHTMMFTRLFLLVQPERNSCHPERSEWSQLPIRLLAHYVEILRRTLLVRLRMTTKIRMAAKKMGSVQKHATCRTSA